MMKVMLGGLCGYYGPNTTCSSYKLSAQKVYLGPFMVAMSLLGSSVVLMVRSSGLFFSNFWIYLAILFWFRAFINLLTNEAKAREFEY